jgi:glycosyltransferase involved in cell wall biosynthesis
VRNIEECIKSAEAFEEVVVVDSNSSDRTLDLVNSLGVRIVNFTWNGRYPKKRQWCLDCLELKHDWVFFLDADERVTFELEKEIERLFEKKEQDFAAAEIKISYFFGGKRLKYGIKPKKIVLMHRKRANYIQLADEDIPGMGELEGHFQPQIVGKVISLKSSIDHDDKDPILDWFARHVRYAEWESRVMRDDYMKKNVMMSKNLLPRLFHKMFGKPIIFFVVSYFFRLGFLDGITGFRYAAAKSWYYWIVSLGEF